MAGVGGGVSDLKTIWFHVGAPKTGTTSIQDFCRQNLDALAARGVWYPLLDRVEANTGRSRQPSAHHLLAHELRGSAPRHRRKLPGTGAKQFQRILEEFRIGPHPAMLLSAETFFQHSAMFAASNLPLELSSFDVSVICYVRRSDEFVESLYKTVVAGQGRGATTLERFAKRAAPDYPRRLQGFLNLVPSGNVIIRSFDEARPRLLEDFLSLLPSGLDDGLQARIPNEYKNIALGAKQILFLRRLNLLGVSLEDFLAVRRSFRTARKAPDRLSLMPHELRRRLIDAYNSDVQALNEAYGCSIPAVTGSDAEKEVLEDLTSDQVAEIMEDLRQRPGEPTWSRLAAALDVSAASPSAVRVQRRQRRERRLATS